MLAQASVHGTRHTVSDTYINPVLRFSTRAFNACMLVVSMWHAMPQTHLQLSGLCYTMPALADAGSVTQHYNHRMQAKLRLDGQSLIALKASHITRAG